MEKRRERIVTAVARQAVAVLSDGCRFQVRKDVIGADDDVRRFLNSIIVATGSSIRASQFDGLLTLYNEDDDEGAEVVIATVKK